MNFKIMVTVSASIFVAVLIFYFFIDLYIHIYDPSWKGLSAFWIDHNLRHKEIFIIGSSSVYSINATYVSEYLSERGKDYDVYDLADMSDEPSSRLKSLENIISLRPDIVVYGIGLKDFEKSHSINESQTPLSKDNILTQILNPHKFFVELLSHFGYDDLAKSPSSPKDRTILALKFIVRGPEYPNHPFINFKNTRISSPLELQQTFGSQSPFRGIGDPDKNKEVLALKKLIGELQKNNIKVIVFTVPYHRIVLDTVNDSDKSLFTSILRNISKESGVGVYFLHGKYEDLDIWRDVVHVAVNKTASIYSEDVAKIILNEVEH